MTEGDLERTEPQMSPGLGYMGSGIKGSDWELVRWRSRHRDCCHMGQPELDQDTDLIKEGESQLLHVVL